jgi:hypothetical protein
MNNFIAEAGYSVKYAKPLKRLAAYACDYVFLLVIAMVAVSIIAREKIIEYNELQEIKKREPMEIVLGVDDTGEDDSKESEITDEEEKASLKRELVEDVEKKQKEILYKTATNKTVKNIVLLIVFAYHLLFALSKQQATPGQRMFSLMTVRFDGGKITFIDALNRVTLLLLLNVLAALCVFSKKKLTIYDYLSKTTVIEIK